MRRKGAENAVLYLKAIPGMIKLLAAERADLEDDYCGLRGTAMDGMPRAVNPGMPTEAQALKTEARGIYERLQEISVRMEVLTGDAALIRGAMDDLSDKYKHLLTLRLLRGYSWVKIGVQFHKSDSTVRYWYRDALIKLAEVLSETPMPEELEARARRARSL